MNARSEAVELKTSPSTIDLQLVVLCCWIKVLL